MYCTRNKRRLHTKCVKERETKELVSQNVTSSIWSHPEHYRVSYSRRFLLPFQPAAAQPALSSTTPTHPTLTTTSIHLGIDFLSLLQSCCLVPLCVHAAVNELSRDPGIYHGHTSFTCCSSTCIDSVGWF